MRLDISFILFVLSLSFSARVSAAAEVIAREPELKVALLGDTSASSGFKSVLQLIKSEQADVIMINGDFGYSDTPKKWQEKLLEVIDVNQQPVIGALGNHDFELNRATEYIRIFKSFRTASNGLNLKCSGGDSLIQNKEIAAIDEVCTFGNVTIIPSAIGLVFNKKYFETRLEEKLKSAPQSNWTLVGYHFTLKTMNPGLKSDEASPRFFDLIRQFGAIGAQAHTHSVMASCPIDSVFTTNATPTCHRDFGPDLSSRFVGDGTGMFLDSSLGGMPARGRKRCQAGTESDCQHMVDLITRQGYTRSDGRSFANFTKLGAMFVVFNSGGDPARAQVYFKSTDGQEIFRFSIRRD